MATRERVRELEALLRLSLRFIDHKRTMQPDGSWKPCEVGKSGGKGCDCGYHDLLKQFEKAGI